MSIVSIGYSALSSSLMVTGEANFRVREDVRITGLKVLSTSNSGGETYPSEYYKDGTKVMVTLPNLNSTITYQVEVINNTKVDYYLKSKTDATNSNTSMQYTLSGAMNEQSPIKANTKSTFNIVISYKSGIALPSNKNLTLETRYIFDILDVTPPTVTFNPQGGEYKAFQTVRITASDEHYDHMDVEVRDGSNAKIDAKSKTGITSTTYDVALDSYGTYKILVKAYDKRGNKQTNTPLENGYTYQEYVIKKPTVNFVEYLKSQANPSSITTYASGKKQEMYTFSHPDTYQIGALTDYRYIGNTPNNYVYFNCQNDSQVSTCEIWRIIGVFSVKNGTGNWEERVKIIRGQPLENTQTWNDNDYGTNYDDYKKRNDWMDSDVRIYLNNTYYKSLSSTAQTMTGNAQYYLGAATTDAPLSATVAYTKERATGWDSKRAINWTGNIGLIYPSDYIYTYALGVDSICYNDVTNCHAVWDAFPESGWMFSSYDEWTITADRGQSEAVMYISDGPIYHDPGPCYHEVRPVLYLTTDIVKVDGDGSQGNPYHLAINSN